MQNKHKDIYKFIYICIHDWIFLVIKTIQTIFNYMCIFEYYIHYIGGVRFPPKRTKTCIKKGNSFITDHHCMQSNSWDGAFLCFSTNLPSLLMNKGGGETDGQRPGVGLNVLWEKTCVKVQRGWRRKTTQPTV